MKYSDSIGRFVCFQENKDSVTNLRDSLTNTTDLIRRRFLQWLLCVDLYRCSSAQSVKTGMQFVICAHWQVFKMSGAVYCLLSCFKALFFLAQPDSWD